MESKKGSVRRLFPGGNTSLGFQSFYDFILPQEEASRIMVIKGGPGTGKSTFMRKIAEEMLNRGYDVEFHQCSSDNDSIDGIVIPAIKVALIDGTAPHVVDPKHPGAIDEIINLGEYWNEEKMSSSRDEILNCTKRISRMYKIAYSLLAEAKIAYNEWKSYISESINTPEHNRIVRTLLDEIFKDAEVNYTVPVKHRHLFASAITPGGPKNYIETILKPGMNVYCLGGSPGSGVKETISLIAKNALDTGLYAEEFHCPFEPELLDMVIIPSINTAVLNTSMPFHYDVSKIEGLVIKGMVNFDTCIQEKILGQYTLELDDVKERFYSLVNKAVSHIRRSKSIHDEMEKYYVSAMDFDMIAAKREDVLQRILKIAEK
jgi:hypothetical protein